MGDKKHTLYRILLICWMILIFYLSSQDGDTSQNLSDGLLGFLFKSLANNEFFQFLIRKCAHAFEYFALAIFGNLNFKDKKQNLLFCILYAISDEIHQYFVPNRAMLFSDVCVDTMGSFLGMLVCELFNYVRNVAKRKSAKIRN